MDRLYPALHLATVVVMTRGVILWVGMYAAFVATVSTALMVWR